MNKALRLIAFALLFAIVPPQCLAEESAPHSSETVGRDNAIVEALIRIPGATIKGSRSAHACEYLTKIILATNQPAEQDRYFRAMDFQVLDAAAEALIAMLGQNH